MSNCLSKCNEFPFTIFFLALFCRVYRLREVLWKPRFREYRKFRAMHQVSVPVVNKMFFCRVFKEKRLNGRIEVRSLRLKSQNRQNSFFEKIPKSLEFVQNVFHFDTKISPNLSTHILFGSPVTRAIPSTTLAIPQTRSAFRVPIANRTLSQTRVNATV